MVKNRETTSVPCSPELEIVKEKAEKSITKTKGKAQKDKKQQVKSNVNKNKSGKATEQNKTDAGSTIHTKTVNHDNSPRILKTVNANESLSVHSSPEGVNADSQHEAFNFALSQLFALTGQDMDELKGLTLEEKKKYLRQKNAELEAAVKQEEQQEDDELRQLMVKQDQLKRKLSEMSDKGGKKKGNMINYENVSEAEESVIADSELVQSSLPKLDEIKNMLHIADKRVKTKKGKCARRKGSRRSMKRRETSSDSSDSETSTSDSETEFEDDSASEDEVHHKKSKKSKRIKSGLYAKPGTVNIVSGECYAHTTLDDEIGGQKELKDLSFNLLVAGELEIIGNKGVPKNERDTRIKVMKKLAYKAEYLPNEEIIKQYANFVHKVERGKYRWGSRSTLQAFEQQLVYCISINNKHKEGQFSRKSHKNSESKFQDRIKYCLDFNRGTCKLENGHEGKLNGQMVFKAHICKACLVREGMEAKHPEKECPHKK